jgi:phenylpyruvate tautomerase PptA (4-oxalocrotonate tautomerase family)
VRLYKSERAALVKASETAIKLGLAERVVRVEEQRAELVARVLLSTLEALNLPPEIAARAPMILREQLLALESTSLEAGGEA